MDYACEYFERNPGWHVADSGWKAGHIVRLLQRHQIEAASIAEVGCGAGAVLRHVHDALPAVRQFVGYDIAEAALDLARPLETERLRFQRADLAVVSERYDVVLAIDVLEHVDDYLGFLRKLRERARWAVFHVPLDLSVSAMLRPARLLQTRSGVGHLHYFTFETTLATLHDTGYEVVEARLTAGALELPRRALGTRLANIPRSLVALVSSALAARMFGGYSVLVLARAGP